MLCNAIAMLRGANVRSAVSRVTWARVTVTNAPGLLLVVVSVLVLEKVPSEGS